MRGAVLTSFQTVVAGIIAYVLLPTNILTASFLTEEEKKFATDRLQGKIRSGSGSPDRFEYDCLSYPRVDA